MSLNNKRLLPDYAAVHKKERIQHKRRLLIMKIDDFNRQHEATEKWMKLEQRRRRKMWKWWPPKQKYTVILGREEAKVMLELFCLFCFAVLRLFGIRGPGRLKRRRASF
jgi:chromatin segregation and condensation protein Rec8/ScpA/Scc1 (kleisin family)